MKLPSFLSSGSSKTTTTPNGKSKVSNPGSSSHHERSEAKSHGSAAPRVPESDDEELEIEDYDSQVRIQVESELDNTIGGEARIRELYREDDRYPWDEWKPDDVDRDAEESAESKRCAVISRQQVDRKKGTLYLHSIVINSPLLRKVLHGVFEGYEGMSTRLKDLKFYTPFHEFYYRWHRFEQAYKEEQDKTTKKHLDLLYPLVRKEIIPHIDTMNDLTKNGLINFDYLWAIFVPAMDVYSKLDGQDRLFHVRSSRYVQDRMTGGLIFSISCSYIDCDGDKFGYVRTSLQIDQFAGVKKIVDLNAFPSHLHPDLESLLEKLHRRGKEFEALNGFNHMSYSGYYIDKSQRRTQRKRHITSGRIIIDPKTFLIQNPDSGRDMNTLTEEHSTNPYGEGDDFMNGIFNVIHRAGMQALSKFVQMMDSYEANKLSESSSTLTPNQRLLCTPVVRGFCLASKRWGEFYVDNISPINWNDNAFRGLVLAKGYKEIIHAFVQEQLSGEDSFDDIIDSKGQGFIMLLSGEPGVGKTLTAESVSEEMRKPLYYVTAGELGKAANEVEDSLENILELTTTWGAVLLLDECDIFLAERSATDMDRNTLVSIFLKQLEYYRGVMFLTTNRRATIDAAFESRIHLVLDYPNLGYDSRLHIWRTFVRPRDDRTLYASNVSEDELQHLAKHLINGRQIKNVVKTARLLAKQQKKALNMEHLNLVLQVKNVGPTDQPDR